MTKEQLIDEFIDTYSWGEIGFDPTVITPIAIKMLVSRAYNLGWDSALTGYEYPPIKKVEE